MRVFLACVRAVFDTTPRVLSRCWTDVTARLLDLHASVEARDMAPGSNLR